MTGAPFSLLLPYYGGDDPEFLARAFRSAVEDQSLPPDDVVLVQDGPVPAALARTAARLVADSSRPVAAIGLADNRGLAVALNEGLRACRHDIVARMDADDIALPGRFAVQLPVLVERRLDLLGAGMFEFASEHGEVLGRRTPPTGPQRIATYARFHDPFNHPTVVYRRSAVQAAGGYEAIGLMEDYSLFARMIAAGARVDNLEEALVMYRVSAGAYSRRGGLAQLRAEIALQHQFRRMGFTSRTQHVRNLIVRGGYRLVPEAVRKMAYRRLIVRGYRA